MASRVALVTGVIQAILLAAVVWLVSGGDAAVAWVPPMLAAAALVRPLLAATGPAEPFASIVIAVSAAAALLVHAGWAVCGGWLLLALAVTGLGRVASGRRRMLALAAGQLAIVGWGVAFALEPELLTAGPGGWLTPAVLLVAARRLGMWRSHEAGEPARALAPPSREVRGTLTLDGVVLADSDRLRLSAPLELELRAGESLAVLCDDPLLGEALLETLSGRRPVLAGEVSVDGVPITSKDRLAAVIARGEPFIIGDLEENLEALASTEAEPGTLAAAHESCSLEGAVQRIGDRRLKPDGEPLTALERLLVQAGRVLCSEYRVVVVLDSSPWVNTVRAETWRQAVVRASVGRTSIWVTLDRDLARRARQVMELRHGVLRPVSEPPLSWRNE